MQELRPHAARLGAAALLASAVATHAADPRLEEIIVTAPMHKGEAETVHPTSLIAGNELRRRIAATLGETLKQEPGVAFSSFGPGVGQPVIRGQGAPRVLVLQNSMPVGDAANTSADHANATEPVLADRIEVLRGPATLLYGSGAIGGVVNVIDNRVPATVPGAPGGALEYRHGSNAGNDVLAGRLDAGAGDVAMHLDGFGRDSGEVGIPGNALRDGGGSEGSIENSEAQATGATAGASWVFGRGFLGMAVSRLDNEYGVPPGAHDHAEHEGHDEDGDHALALEEDGREDEAGAEDVRIDLQQTRYDLRAELADPLRGVELLRSYLAYSDYRHDEIESGVTGTRYGNEAWDGRIEAVHRSSDALHGAIGLQLHSRKFTAEGEEAFVPDADGESWGVFLVEDLHVGDVVYEFGLRAGRDSHDPARGDARDFGTVSGSVSALWSLDDVQTLKFALSGAERAPAMEELYSDGVHVATRSYELGDESLDEERSLNADLGYHLHEGAVDFRIDAFYNRYDDYIFQRATGVFFNPELALLEPVCSADHEDECLEVLQWAAAATDFYGLESELRLELPRGFTLAIFGDHVRGEFDDGGAVPRVPPGRLGAELAWQRGGWDLAARLTEVLEQDRTGEGERSVPGYTLLAARAEYAFSGGGGDWTLFLRGENLLDEEIRNASSLLRDVAPEAGLNVEAGVRLAF
ncbi:MAG: TonB-dependent receptor [Gammaproteobacteria bacterium]|nr:TonB-dependent receptor [Gammaproteobacteria bacterium]